MPFALKAALLLLWSAASCVNATPLSSAPSRRWGNAVYTKSPTPPPTVATRAVDWNAGFSDADKRKMSANTGDKLKFSWTGGHNVYLMASKAAFDACNFTGGTNLGATSPVSYTVPQSSEKIYFGCEVGMHCSAGQKLAVTVGGNPPGVSGPSMSSATRADTGSWAVAVAMLVVLAGALCAGD